MVRSLLLLKIASDAALVRRGVNLQQDFVVFDHPPMIFCCFKIETVSVCMLTELVMLGLLAPNF